MSPHPTVVKVGGSLFDLPDLGQRLRRWLDGLPGPEVILVPGGGPAADVIRALDRRHRLGEEASHWLALRVLSVNAHFLAALLPRAVVVEKLDDCSEAWRRLQVAVLDAHAFCRADDTTAAALPHRWSVTSDSVAARVAVVAGARRLILLKSVTVPAGIDWSQAPQVGLVDDFFAMVVRTAALEVEAVNFREWQL
jgi:aspartokinase-like uncharacterized kinase